MISPRKQRVIKALAIVLACSFSQICIPIGLAAPTSPVEPQRLIAANLRTTGNRNIMVNGAAVATGTTILTGSRIETGDQIGATITLGDLSTLELGPNTIVVLNYNDDGDVNVTLVQGCMVLTANRGAKGKVDTQQGTAGETDKATGGALNFCRLAGVLNPGSATNVGAGAAAGSVGGTSNAVWWAIGLTSVGTGLGLWWAFRDTSD